MKKIHFTWEIPRSDKRDRCALCFNPFKPLQAKIKIAKSGAMRFPNLCKPCYGKSSVKVSA